jgi:hypothetical protein
VSGCRGKTTPARSLRRPMVIASSTMGQLPGALTTMLRRIRAWARTGRGRHQFVIAAGAPLPARIDADALALDPRIIGSACPGAIIRTAARRSDRHGSLAGPAATRPRVRR